MPPSPSDSSLHGLVGQLLPQLMAEIGATQDEVRRASARLGRVPPALLQNGSKAALDSAQGLLDKASDQIVVCLQKLHEQYPASSASG